jgi:hypothetical protein
MHPYHVHYPQTYERSRRRAPLHCFSTLPRSMLICLAPRDLYSPADLIGPQHSASRLYNEYRDQVERAHGLPVTSRAVVLWPRVSVSKVRVHGPCMPPRGP